MQAGVDFHPWAGVRSVRRQAGPHLEPFRLRASPATDVLVLFAVLRDVGHHRNAPTPMRRGARMTPIWEKRSNTPFSHSKWESIGLGVEPGSPSSFSSDPSADAQGLVGGVWLVLPEIGGARMEGYRSHFRSKVSPVGAIRCQRSSSRFLIRVGRVASPRGCRRLQLHLRT